MRLYDSHAHFRADADEVKNILARAKSAGVERVMAIGADASANDGAVTARNCDADQVLVALGYDRENIVKGMTSKDLDGFVDDLRKRLDRQLDEGGLAALGEIGLDFMCDPDSSNEQGELFARELQMADEYALPVSIHTRGSDDATISILDEVPWHHDSKRGVIHCFTGSRQFASKLLDRGFNLSISGIVTFKSADNVRDTALYVPDSSLMIETDAPFLAPVPMRGKTNEPAYVAHTCEFLARLKNMDSDALAMMTFKNASDIFKEVKNENQCNAR